jgi:Zn-dependent metalloprotease
MRTLKPIITAGLFAALLIAVTTPLVNAAETQNLRENPQILERAKAASGNAGDPGFRAALGLSGDEELDVLRAYPVARGGTVTRYRQMYRGVPVWGEQIVIGRDASGQVRSLHGRVVRDLAIGLQQVSPSLNSDDALQAMKDRVRASFPNADDVVFKNERSELVIYLDDGVPRLSQSVSFFADSIGGGNPTRPTFIVDALTGDVLFEYEGLTFSHSGYPIPRLSEEGLFGPTPGRGKKKVQRWQYFDVTVPPEIPTGERLRLRASIAGDNGDADLYIRKDVDPTFSTYTCRSASPSSNEECSALTTAGDKWKIGIYAYSDYTDVDLLAEVEILTPSNGTGPGGNAKTGQHEYDGTFHNGTFYNFLDVVDVNGHGTCVMDNADVKTVDLNHGTSGSTAFGYECYDNTHKFINDAYSPLNDAHYFGGVVFDMYQDYMSVSPLAFQLTMRVHYSTNYENAFWNGSSMTFGDGKDKFYPLVSLDVSAHEVSHGFTEQNSNLIYSGQSGGINEAFSDIAGEAAEFYMRGSNDFLVGAEIFKADGALRYMCNPSDDGKSIDHVDFYYPGLDVHYSSGVFNKAFCLLAQTNGWNVQNAFQAFAGANQLYWTPSTNFVEGAQGVVDAAHYDLNFGALAVQDVMAAFAAVGIAPLVDPGSLPPPPPPGEVGSVTGTIKKGKDPLQGVTFKVDSVAIDSVTTDGGGNYTLENVLLGNRSITATSTKGCSKTQSVEVFLEGSTLDMRWKC